jgi:serine/threonine protein kinase
MSVVYKAEDTRLGRFAALKFLSEALARERLALDSCKREARAASFFNHPHICTICDIEEPEGDTFIVMEPREGRTLAQRISATGRSPVPVDELLDLASQLADALETAHAKGMRARP